MQKDSLKPGPRRLRVFLPDGLTNTLKRRVDEGLRLQQAWMGAVPQPLVSHCHPVRYAAGLLVVHVDTPPWASRLRHQQPAIVAALRRYPLFRDLTDLHVRVMPADSTDSRPAMVRPGTRLSPKVARIIQSTAATIADAELRAALERLAQRADTSSEKQKP